MNNIKARAWDKKIKKFHYWDFASNINAIFWEMARKEKMPINFFIGLRDNNKKEIFNGDILARKGDRAYYLVGMGKVGFTLTKHIDGEKYASNFQFSYYGNEKGRVIGNIYENPELLKGDLK
jgi:uncharacterized phage protein (TIGR01671 family)